MDSESINTRERKTIDRNAFFRRIPKIDNILEEEQILSFIQDLRFILCYGLRKA